MKTAFSQQPQLAPVELSIIDLAAVDTYPHVSSETRQAVAAKLGQMMAVQFELVKPSGKLPGWVDQARRNNFDPEATSSIEHPIGCWTDTVLQEYGQVNNATIALMAKTYSQEIGPVSQEAPKFAEPEAQVVKAALGWRAVKSDDPTVRLTARLARQRYLNGRFSLADLLIDGPFGDSKFVRALASVLL